MDTAAIYILILIFSNTSVVQVSYTERPGTVYSNPMAQCQTAGRYALEKGQTSLKANPKLPRPVAFYCIPGGWS